jgi:hypothetical protein
LEDRELTVYVLTSLVLIAVGVYIGLMIGWIDTPHGGFHDGPPLPPPNTISLEQGNTTQTYPRWMTEFLIVRIRGTTDHPLENLTFAVVEGGDAILTDLNITFHDIDDDGNASLGDMIFIANMTDDVNDSQLEVYLDDDVVARHGVSWNVNDPLIYAAFLYWNHPVKANGSRWYTNFSVTHLAMPFDVHPANLSFEVRGETGALLDEAIVTFQDWRRDGILSDFDRVHVDGMTEEYQRATVRMSIDGVLVAIGTVPQWIF